MLNAFSYRVTAVHAWTECISQVLLLPADFPAFIYQAGQYIEVIHADGGLSPLSLACAPNVKNELEFHLFHTPRNQKANDLLQQACQEKHWHFYGPHGSCTVNRLDPEKPIIFLARGTGFAPIKAVMEALLQANTLPPMYFYWSVAVRNDLYLLDLLEKWEKSIPGFTFIPVLTQETGSHVLPEIILRAHPDLAAFQVYASGPQPLITTAFTDFVKHGLPPECFYSDLPTTVR